MLLGRSAEQEAVSRVLASARLGRGAALVVTGDPGIGKTALLVDALAGPGTGGARVLHATATEVEQDLPFATLHALLLPILHLLEEIPGPQADALGSALSLRRGGVPDRFAIGAATISLLSRYAEQAPVCVVLDDAQWADGPSVEALAFAARRVGEDPIAVLVAGRAGELSEALGDLPVLALPGLDAEAAARLVSASEVGTRADLDRLHRLTGGNPLALMELAHHLDTGALTGTDPSVLPHTLPERLQDAFARHLARLTPQDRVVAVVAAVSGGDLRLVRAGCEHLDVDPAGLERMQQAGLLTVDRGRVTFRHPLVRSAAYGSAPVGTRRSVHRALADLLTATADLDRRTWHLVAATTGLDEGLATQLEALAGRAAARSAFTVAATALERSAGFSTDPDRSRSRLVGAAAAAWTGGQATRALQLLDQAESPAGPVTVAGAELRATIAVRSGSLREGLSMLEHAADLATPDERVLLLADACQACLYLVDTAALTRVESELSTALRLTTDPLARSVGQAAAGAAGVLLGRRDSTPQLREAVADLAEARDPLAHPAALPWLMLAPLFLRDAASGAELRALVDAARSRVGVGVLPNLLFHVARDQATSTVWDRAAANYEEAARLARETGQSTELAMALAGMAWLESRRGQDAACQQHATEALARCRERFIHFGEIWCELALGDLRLSQGRAPEAVARFRALARRLEELDVRDPDLHPGPEFVDALRRTGQDREALEVAHGFVGLVRAVTRPWSQARAERALGLIAVEDAFEEHFGSALDHHGRTRDIFETGRTHLAHGMRLRRAGRRVQSRVALREALGIFEGLGAGRWADNTRAELGATGEKVPPRDADGAGALTPQELQVCLLLARGRTTREAGAALFLSPKTIEYHLRKAYTKLGIHSRGELAVALHEAD
ncbi:helix-turn-helix transcriptional regulator [Ornithinimicrobium cavernae]|uniref:helix-turn-helix transcriptional regulator n=1 Tax=Ornithinimicrobium cavernae TaxID=2666047 RepID=UPI001379F980|nr:AAA family ATPase [Ornithinimicrobium cavernae]